MLAELETAVDQRSVNGRPASVCDNWGTWDAWNQQNVAGV